MMRNQELWILTGERCAAAETIFTYCTGESVLGEQGEGLPRTMEDLRRCRLLFDLCPDLRSCLPRVGHLSREWANIVSFWDDLCTMQDLEDPDWKEAAGSAPQTQAMLNEFIGRKTAE